VLQASVKPSDVVSLRCETSLPRHAGAAASRGQKWQHNTVFGMRWTQRGNCGTKRAIPGMQYSNLIQCLQALLLVGGAVGSREIAKDVARAQRDQAALVAQLENQTARSLGAPRKPKVAVDRLFAERLARILRMCGCCPSVSRCAQLSICTVAAIPASAHAASKYRWAAMAEQHQPGSARMPRLEVKAGSSWHDSMLVHRGSLFRDN